MVIYLIKVEKMGDFGFWIFITVVVVLMANGEGSFDKYISDKNFKEVQELKKLKVQDDETIRDLQERLEKAGLDNGIG